MFYVPLAWGLLAYQLQPGAPLSPGGLRTSGSIHSPSTIWAKSQTGGKTNQGAREVSGARFTECPGLRGPASDVSAPLSAVGWECYRVKLSTCLLTPRCAALPSPGILSSVQRMSHGLLSFCPREGLGVPILNSIFARFKP